MEDVRAGVYKHYKGKYYLLLGIARHSETDEALVVYVPLYLREGPRMSARPYKMFFETIDIDGKKVKRFEYIGPEMPQNFSGE